MAKKGIKKFYKILMVLMLALQFLPALSTPVVAEQVKLVTGKSLKN